MEESKAIPVREIHRVLEILPYASTSRVMFEMLAFTGCRLAELDNMRWSLLKEEWLYWKLGKNQTSYRKVKLPSQYIQELRDYRESHKVVADVLFGLTSDSFRRHFNRYTRGLIGDEWLLKSEFLKNGFFVPEYKLQLKGLRKTYQTLLFKKELEKWDNPEVALQFTCKEMRHSSERITAYHYLVNFDSIGAEKNIVVVEDLAHNPVQRLLVDFL
ncbi:MAG: hypothetical protein ACP5N3_04220 [Candidatus Nanoarchaeia archaeon]